MARTTRVTVQLAGNPRGPLSRLRAAIRDHRASRRATREFRQAMAPFGRI